MNSQTLSIQKVAAALVGVAMIAGATFAFAAQRAHAATLAELVELFIALDIISSDKADDAREAVKDMDGGSSSTGGSTTGGSCSFTFTQNLTVGSTGAEVLGLQKFLNLSADTMVAAAGPGSKGLETSYFGPATAAAVSKFQVKYASEILAPLGLTMGTGNFGASTRAKANAVCAGMPSTPTTPGDDDDDDDDDNSMSDEEASLEDFNALNTYSNEDVAAGDEETGVYAFEFDVEDGDVEINRVDVVFQAKLAGAHSNDPWDYFEEVQIMNEDGDVLASAAADDEDNWDEFDDESNSTAGASDAYRMRFNNVDDAMFNAGENARLSVGVTMQSGIDSDDEGEEWYVWVPEDGIRAVDGAGLDQYAPDSDVSDSEFKKFTIEAEGADDELSVKLASSNPDASTIKVDEDDETEDVTVLVFEIEAGDHDLELNTIPVDFWITGGEDYEQVVSDVRIDIDGEEFELDEVTGEDTAMASTTFDIDGDVVIEADDKAVVKVIVDLLKQDGNYDNGTMIRAELSAANVDDIDAEGADDVTDLSGSALGEDHTLLAQGIFAEIVSTDANVNNGDDNANDEGNFVIKFDVTAFEDTFYIGSTTAAAVDYDVLQGGSVYTGGTTSASLTSTASKESGTIRNFRIDEGETETFTLTVSVNPAATGFFSVILNSVNFNADNTSTYGESYEVTPVDDFETDEIQLDA